MQTTSPTFFRRTIRLAAILPLITSLVTPVGAKESDSAFSAAVRQTASDTRAQKVRATRRPAGAQSKNATTNPATPVVQEDDKIRHLLNRITFGATAEDIARVKKIGIDRYIDEQLNPQSIPESEAVVALVSNSPALLQSPAQLFLNYGRPVLVALAKAGKIGPNAVNNQLNQVSDRSATSGNDEPMRQQPNRANDQGDMDANKMEMQESRGNSQPQKNFADNEKKNKEINQLIGAGYKQLYTQVAEARIKRAVYSPRQLEEVMTDFWYNHFNISIDKGLDHIWVGSFEEQAIRPYALGNFRDILGATAHHAAMMFYLDNNQNSKPRDPQLAAGKKPGRFSGLNENYARELMELHTLGVDGGYTQKDVTELARVLTGHGIINQQSVKRFPDQMDDPFGYWFDKNRHDFTDKTVLGHVIKGRGADEVEEALDLLAKHPSTAHHISYQLAQYFVADEPPSSLVDKMANTFTRTDGDIKEVLKTMFKSNEFWDPKYYNAKFKSPYRYLVSSLRATDASVQNTQPLLGFLNLQGMPLYRCLTPDGYKNTQSAWLNSSTLLQRVNFATALASGRYPGAKISDVPPEELMGVIGIKSGSSTAEAVDSAPNQLKLSLLIGSPEFMRY